MLSPVSLQHHLSRAFPKPSTLPQEAGARVRGGAALESDALLAMAQVLSSGALFSSGVVLQGNA